MGGFGSCLLYDAIFRVVITMRTQIIPTGLDVVPSAFANTLAWDETSSDQRGCACACARVEGEFGRGFVTSALFKVGKRFDVNN